MSERYSLFRGCLIPTRLPYLEKSSRMVLDEMEVDYELLPGATCCIEPIGLRSMAVDTWLAVSARMLSIAEEWGRDLLTLCNGCFMSLKEAAHVLERRDARERVNEVLAKVGREYRGEVEVIHLVELLQRREDDIKSRVVSPQDHLKFAVHPGCHLLRPSEVMKTDFPFSPQLLNRLASWSGAEVVHSPDWPPCCGGGLTGVDDELSSDILKETVREFQKAGAQHILTPCPFCFTQFDLKRESEVPVMFISELLALALGAQEEEIGLDKHRTKFTQ